MPTAEAGATSAPAHLIVLLHGIAGIPDNLAGARRVRESSRAGKCVTLSSLRTAAVLARVLRERFGASALVYVAACYTTTRTLDGIDVCAERVLRELRVLVAQHSSLRALSLLGYSFGGLVRRGEALLGSVVRVT